MKCFDEKKWREELTQQDWYFHITPELKKLREKTKQENDEKWNQCKEEVYGFFEEQLRAGEVALGRTGKNFDAEQKPLDTVVIHHTHNQPGITPGRLSVMTLLRLYAPYFAKPYGKQDREIQGQPVYSGHFRDGKQVFYPYHWIVRTNGKTERLLNDSEIGWHAGDWNVNTKSVAIVLDNNYEDSRPSDAELEAVAGVIKENYASVPKERVLGHREVNQKTTCPSNLFLSKGSVSGWKEDLLELL